MERKDLPVGVPMQHEDLPEMVPRQRTGIPVGVPMHGTEMPATKMTIQDPSPSDKAGTLHQEVRFFVLVGFIVIGCLVAIAGIFLLTGTDMGGRTATSREKGALTPHLKKIGENIRTMLAWVKEGPKSDKPQMKRKTPVDPSSGVTNRAKPLPSNMMVCTVNGEGPRLEDIRPPGSSVCGIIFFDSQYKKVRKEVAVRFAKNFKSFLQWTHLHPYATLGMSFSLENHKLARDIADSKFKDGIKNLCKKGIMHAAVINVYGDTVNDGNFNVALKALQIAHETLFRCTPSEPSYVVLGASIDQPTARRLVGQMKQNFVPSLFISITHVSYDDRRRHDCRIVPPTWLDAPKNLKQTDLTYGRPLVESCSVLPVLANGVGIPVAISFSLSGHMYKPRFVDPASPTSEEYKLFRPCEDFDGNYYVSPPQICKNVTQLTKDVTTTKLGVVAFDTSMERTLTFDSKKTLNEKVCATKNKCQGVNFGLATYDLEYDAERLAGQVPACETYGTPGSFYRCNVLLKVHGYLASLSTTNPWSMSKCLEHVHV